MESRKFEKSNLISPTPSVTTPAVINETVAVAKEYLDGELKKCETWEECKTKKSYLINLLGTTMQEDNYQSLRSRGVGQTTLLKFLGKNWKQHRIQQALEDLKGEAGLFERGLNYYCFNFPVNYIRPLVLLTSLCPNNACIVRISVPR